MTVEWLIHLLSLQDPKATAYLWTDRVSPSGVPFRNPEPERCGILEVTTFPGEEGVYLIEHDDRNYF